MPVKRRVTREIEVAPEAVSAPASKKKKASWVPVYLLLAAVVASTWGAWSFLTPRGALEEVAPQATPLPFDATLPFSLQDLTAGQMIEVRASGSIHLSDGPRGISVGDSLDKLLASYPSDYDDTLGSAEGERILYCQTVFTNLNGVPTALPPRGILTDDGGRNLVVTLMTPTASYPAGTADDYRTFEHLYCRYTIDPESMCVSAIVVGLT